MKKSISKVFRSALTGLLAVVMVATSAFTGDTSVYAAEAYTGSETLQTGDRTVTLGHFENGSLSFEDSRKSSCDFAIGDTVTVYAEPSDGYVLNRVAVLDESDNQYPYMLTGNQITFKAPAYDVKVYAQFTSGTSGTYGQESADWSDIGNKPDRMTDEEWMRFVEIVKNFGPRNYVEEIEFDSSYVDVDSIDGDSVEYMMAVTEDCEDNYVIVDVDGDSDYYVMLHVTEDTVESLPDDVIVDLDNGIGYVPKDSVEVDADGENTVIMPVESAAVLAAATGGSVTAHGTNLGVHVTIHGYDGAKGMCKLWIDDNPYAFCLDPGLLAPGYRYGNDPELVLNMWYLRCIGQYFDEYIEKYPQNDMLYYIGIQYYIWEYLLTEQPFFDIDDIPDYMYYELAEFYRQYSGMSDEDSLITANAVLWELVMGIGDIYDTINTNDSKLRTDAYMYTAYNASDYDRLQRLIVFRTYPPHDDPHDPVTPQPGILLIQKFSDDPFWTNDNSNYSLEGAVFRIECSGAWDGVSYVKDAEGNDTSTKILVPVSYTVTTDSTGVAYQEIEYEGQWTITEITPPLGFSNAQNYADFYFDDTFDSYFGGGGQLIIDENDLLVMVTDPSRRGSLHIHKATTNGNISGGNSNYSLAGAMYRIKNLDWNNSYTWLMTTDANGDIYLNDIPLGRYEITEVSSSPGYEIWEGSYYVTVGWNNDNSTNYTNLSVSEVPQRRPVSIMLEKYDTEQRDYHCSSNPQGDATLLNAVFHFEFYRETNLTREQIEGGDSTRTLLFEFDAVTVQKDGKNVVDLSNQSTISNWHSTNGSSLSGMYDGYSGSNFCVPYGTLYVYEKTPPVGYTLNDIYVIDGAGSRRVISDANGSTRASYVWNNPDTGSGECSDDKKEVNTVSYLNKVAFSEESMILGSIEITKRDIQNQTITPQGDAKLWSKFGIYNMSAKPVWVDLDHNGTWDAESQIVSNQRLSFFSIHVLSKSITAPLLYHNLSYHQS